MLPCFFTLILPCTRHFLEPYDFQRSSVGFGLRPPPTSRSIFGDQDSMKKLLLFAILSLALPLTFAAEDIKKDSPVYEMRVYYAPPGKLDDLHARFRNHTLRLFEKHGMKNIGYWVPIKNPDNKLVYVLEYPSREAREKAWKAFTSDPEWIAAKAKSEEHGPLVIGNKVESIFMKLTDYSPEPKVEKKGDRVFELRTYTAAEGKLPELNKRFRDHTVKLFEKHGMQNLVYWNLTEEQKGSDNLLIYLLAHKDEDARGQSFRAFGQDPDWQKAFRTSQEDGSLTAQGGVKSEILVPTDYSPMQ